MIHASHASDLASNHQHQVSPIYHQVPTTGHACYCTYSTMTRPEKQDPSHKQQRRASENEKGQRQEQFPCHWSHRQCEVWDADAGKSGSVTTGVGWRTWLHVIAATVAITFGNGSLTLQSSVDFLHLKVSCCLGPRQCTAAHLHKDSAPATGDKAATIPGFLLRGSATLLLPGLYSHLNVNICKYSDHPVCLLDSTD